MSDTLRRKDVKRLVKASKKFSELVEFFNKTHKAVANGALHLRRQKVQLKALIFSNLHHAAEDKESWLKKW